MPSRASVPLLLNGIEARRLSETAISPERANESTSAPASPNGRDSGLSRRVWKSSMGLPSQLAE